MSYEDCVMSNEKCAQHDLSCFYNNIDGVANLAIDCPEKSLWIHINYAPH